MFGYIRPLSGELLVKDSELYSAVYCGLCRQGGKSVSHFTRWLLNYDFVLLALLRISLTGEAVCVERKRCPYRLKKKNCLKADETYSYVCSAFGLLTYYKILDDIHDKKGIARLGVRITKPFFTRIKKRSMKYANLESIIESGLAQLDEAEKSGCASVDRAADGFAGMMGGIVQYGLADDKARIARECGYHVGRFIYIIDALDDLESDEKSGNYNPLIASYGSAAEAMNHLEDIKITLFDSLNALSNSYSLNTGDTLTGVDRLIYNIAELGGRNAYKGVIERKNRK